MRSSFFLEVMEVKVLVMALRYAYEKISSEKPEIIK